MRKIVIVALVVAAAVAAAFYVGLFSRERTASAQGPGGQRAAGTQGHRPAGGGPPGPGGFGGGGGARPPITVELGKVSRGTIGAELTVVGNLIGQSTVEVVPKTGGRLVSVNVRLGDSVVQGRQVAKIEDREIVEQVNQAEASHQVAQATIRQREADLSLASTSLERSRNLFGRQLLPKQTLEDAEARYQAANAQLDLARAQLAQSEARLQELKINLAYTSVTSPVTGFVAKRHVDPGAWVSQSAPIVSVVAIGTLRLVANVVERDLRFVTIGDPAAVEVDAYPGEKFPGRIGHVAPVLDPATRTAEMEVEVPNRDNRLKPGMYARVDLTVDERKNALVLPRTALVDYEGRRGVWRLNEANKARFVPVEVGLEASEQVEIESGLSEGDAVVTTGAASLRADDTLLVAGQNARPGVGGTQGPSAGASTGERGGNSGARRPGAPAAPR